MFEPWVGKSYGKRENILGGLLLLVLGESHYHSDAWMTGKSEAKGTIQDVPKYTIDGSQRFYDGVTQVISGRPKSGMSREEVGAVWDSIVFYNYVPVYVGKGAGERPTATMWRSAPPFFRKVLDEHTPAVVIVCGIQNWGWVMDGFGVKEPWKLSSYKLGDTLFLRMRHPSAQGFSARTYHQEVRHLLIVNSCL